MKDKKKKKKMTNFDDIYLYIYPFPSLLNQYFSFILSLLNTSSN